MPINIVLDKSSYQSFNHNEIILLNGYYRHNVTHVLSFEIIGDLSKEAKEGKKPTPDQVQMLAYRLFPVDNIINVPSQLLAEKELLGKVIPMDGRPVIEMERYIDLPDGGKAAHSKETIMEVAISKWKKGDFSEGDFANSTHWREKTTNADPLTEFKARLGNNPDLNNFKSMDQVYRFIQKFTEDEQQQEGILLGVMKENLKSEVDRFNTMDRWYKAGRPNLSKFIPYNLFCTQVDMMFMLGVLNGLIKNQSTSRVDLQYIHYLPFCDIFSANDKFFDAIVPYFVRTPEQYIKGTTLKEDLKRAWTYIEGITNEEEKRRFFKHPPVLAESFTFKLWNKYFGYPDAETFSGRMTEEEMKEMREKVEAFEESLKSGGIGTEGDPDIFGGYQIKHKNDPCFICNSGKRLIDCCLSEEKFDEARKMQEEKFGNHTDGVMAAKLEYKGKGNDPEM